jgi:hypothetical protein
MKKRLYISNDEAGFFDNNKMLCLDNPPTQGDFIVGDIVVSNKQENGVFGWVCVLAGSPGRWEVINDLRPIQEAIEQIEQRQDNIVNVDIANIKKQITQMAMQALTIDKEHKAELNRINEKVSANTNNILNINTEINTIKQTAGNLQGSIDQVVTGINAQVQANKNNIQTNSNRIAVLEGKQVNNEKEMQDIKTFVGIGAGGDQKGLIQQLEELRELIGANAEGDEEAQKGLIQKLEELRELIGANAEGDEEAQKGIIQQLEELRELIGANAEGEEEARGGIIRDITNIKRMVGYVDGNTYTVPLLEKINRLQNLVGTPAKDDDPATGLHKDIEDLHEVVDEVKEQYLKFWVGTNAEYQALTRVEHGRLYIIID